MAKSLFHLYQGDSSEILDQLIDENVKVDGIITSPPYNLGKNPFHWKKGEGKDSMYDVYSDNLTEDEWLSLMITTFKQYEKILREKGVILFVLSYSSKKPSQPEKLMYWIEEETNLKKRDLIVWKKDNAIPFQTSPNNLSRICELVYVIANKDITYTTNKKVTKINERTNQKFYETIYNFIEAKNQDSHKGINHNATFSEELVKKLMETYFPEGSMILDNFMGTGTVGAVCVQNNMEFIGVELSKLYFDYAKTRLEKLEQDVNLKDFIANICDEVHFRGEMEKCPKTHIGFIKNHNHITTHAGTHPRGFDYYVCTDDECEYVERRIGYVQIIKKTPEKKLCPNGCEGNCNCITKYFDV